MGDLKLVGPLSLSGALHLEGQGGKVLVNGAEALVEGASGNGVSVIQPPPPGTPIGVGPQATCISSLGKTITAGGKALVTTGMVLQGNPAIWPGMVTPSTVNSGPTQVTANSVPVNVKNDKAAVFPNGSTATLDQSGQ